MGKARAMGAKRKRKGGGWRGALKVGVSAAVVFAVLRAFVVQAYRIPSASMEDTLLPGDFVLASKLAFGAPVPWTSWRMPGLRAPEPGDVVIFRFPLELDRQLLKRCVAGPGQTVEVRDKILYVDGARTVDPRRSKYIDAHVLPKESPSGMRDNHGPVSVPPGHYFVIGDNRDNSEDSRFWGFVPAGNILASPFAIYFSWTPDPDAPAWEGLGSLPGVVSYNLAHFFGRVRWDRIARVVE